VAVIAEGELEFAKKYVRDFQLRKWLADRNSRFKITSSIPNVIRIADGSDRTHQIEITVDPVTALPRTETTTSLADPAHPAKSEVRIEEWLSVDGIRFPRRTVTYRNGARVAEITVEEFKLTRRIESKDLAIKPNDLQPVMFRQE